MPASNELILQVHDLSAAADFYQRHLHLPVFLRQPNLIGLNAGPLNLYLEQAPPLGPVLEFFVPDLTQSKRDLLAAGCTLVDDDPTVPRCYLRDPQNLVFNLAQQGR